MGKIIVLANQKGGVGKTTTSINLAASLAAAKKQTLLIDLDSQGNATTGLGVNKSDVQKCAYNILLDETTIDDSSIKIKKFLSLVPSTQNLAGAEIDLVSVENREKRLLEKLNEVKDSFDYIIIDCPPSLGLITINALTAADSVIIPVQCEYYALEGLTQLLNSIRIVQKYLNPSLEIEGVLLTMLDARTNLGLEIVKEVKRYFKEKVYATVIPRSVQLAESPSHGKSIIDYAPNSKGAIVYTNLAKEVIKQNGRKKGK